MASIAQYCASSKTTGASATSSSPSAFASPPRPCLRRVRALEAAGAIRGYHADIDPERVGRGFEVVVHVDLSLKDRSTVERFEAAVAEFEEVVECRRMFGLPDYPTASRCQAPSSTRRST